MTIVALPCCNHSRPVFLFIAFCLFFQVGLGSLELDGAQYAIFGPYDNLCVTSLSRCDPTSGLSVAFWTFMNNGCAGYILSTRDATDYEGLEVSCSFGDLVVNFLFGLQASSEYKKVTVSTSTAIWHHVTVTFSLQDHSSVIYIDGYAVTPSLLHTGTPQNLTASVERKIVVGRRYVTEAVSNTFGYVDDIRVYNRVLSSTEAENVWEAM